MVDATGQPYAYTGDNPVNATDPLGLCSTSGGTFLVSGACHWTSRSWVSQTESTLQGQKGGGFSITNGLKAVADYGAGIGNVVTSTVTLGHVQITAPYCGFGWASDTGTIFGTLAIARVVVLESGGRNDPTPGCLVTALM
jgi:acyl-CoA synthetase (AMP-forming)/AMP-acid ligase II